jgi:GTPase SAR1 family protein
MFYFFITGMAGSGKSTLSSSLGKWFETHGRSVTTVNLDPGAYNLPYSPDVDIRDRVKLDDVMEEYELGPNGALIVSSDLIALQAVEVKKEIEDLGSEIILVDTPGQLELFAYRDAGQVTVSTLSSDERPYLLFLMDSAYVKKPSGFSSLMLLSASIQFRFDVPVLNVLSKADLITEEDVNRINEWAEDPFNLIEDLHMEKATVSILAEAMVEALEQVGSQRKLTAISSTKQEGFDELYAIVDELEPVI